jgi:group I intron endonuclease
MTTYEPDSVDLREKLAHIDGYRTGCGIYIIRNKMTGKVYVGSAFNFSKRWSEHKAKLKRGVHHALRLQHSWNKWGETAFEFIVVERCNMAELLFREQVWLERLRPFDRTIGYNIALVAGSRAGLRATVETRAKMSAAKKGVPQRPEVIAKQSATRKAQCSTPEFRAAASALHRGKTVSDVTRQRQSEAQKRRAPFSAEHRSRLSQAGMGRVVSAETRKKLTGRPRKNTQHGPSNHNTTSTAD